MKSMTGFGRAVFSSENFDASIDVFSVNKKGLELFVNLPRDWQSLENTISAEAKNFYTRGKVQVSIKVNYKSANGALQVSENQLKEGVDAFKKICENLGHSYIENSDTLFQINSALAKEVQISRDTQADWEILKPHLLLALEAADLMRETEGKTLSEDFSKRLNFLEAYAKNIKEFSATTVPNYKETLMARLKNFNLEIDLSDERILKEIAIFADRCDITEELTRLASHISQFKDMLSCAENNGRKMDFICQEIGREINTIGSKANRLEVSKIVIDFKNELERIREQVQNIE